MNKEFEITVQDTFDNTRIFEPQEDMTAKESSLITQGLLVALSGNLMGAQKDLWGWIAENKLERHFPVEVKIELLN